MALMVSRGERCTVRPNSVIVQEKHADYHSPGDSSTQTSLPIRRRATRFLVLKPFTVGIRDEGSGLLLVGNGPVASTSFGVEH